MGCAASNNNILEQKSLIIDESASLKDTTGSVASTTSKSACGSPFCEFDDEFREIRRSRTESMETALTAVVSYNALQQPALDLPCVITDEEFNAMRSSVIATDEEEPKQENTPFQKVERALWIAVKTIEAAKESLSHDERQKLLSIKGTLDKLVEGLQS